MDSIEIRDYIKLYLKEKKRILDAYPILEVSQAVEMLFNCYDQGHTVYAMANGGNAGTVDHIFCDFKHHPFVAEDKSKTLAIPKRLKFVNLCGSPSEITGLVNDLGVEQMYAGALEPLVSSGDLVMGFSGSGNSANVINAFQVAHKAGAKTIAITKGGGGKSLGVVDLCILVPGSSDFPGQTGRNDNNFHFEDAVLSIGSMMCGLLKEKVGREYGS